MSNCYRNLIRPLLLTALVLTLAATLVPCLTIGSTFNPGLKPYSQRELAHSATLDSAPNFPTIYGVQQTGKVNAAFDAFGDFGLGYLRGSPNISAWPATSFETPSGTGTDYLFAGTIWVGGIVNGDTLVSVGADGWQNVGELYPPGYTAANHIGSVNAAEPVGEYAFHASYSDTVHQGINYAEDFPSHRVYQPLNIDVATRSEIWQGAPQNNCILYDVVITNIGQQTIHNGYVGLFMDADVGMVSDQNRSVDDVAGSIRDSGVGYIIDNDGNFNQSAPSLGAFACRFLWNSWGATDTSFNWWISNTIPALDFGPRLRANYRDFGSGGGSGTPEGDVNKYYIMSHPEWDYDQVKTGTTGVSDSLWMFAPAPSAQTFSKGYDTKFLLSLGHFELPPDSSIRFIFTTYAADSVHISADNGKFIKDPASYNPDAYVAGLDFANLYRNAGVADSLAGLLRNPNDPVQGLQIVYSSHDTVIVSWDDWCLGNIDGYNIYLDAIPDSASSTRGIPPRSSSSVKEIPFAQIGRSNRFLITGQDPAPLYMCTVAHRVDSTVGRASSPLIFRFESGSPTGVTTTDPKVPKTFALAQNYPNPFNPSTTISFSNPRNEHVSLEIYNVIGQKILTLLNADLSAGEHKAVWNGLDARNQPVASGIYFYRLKSGGNIATKKMMMLK